MLELHTCPSSETLMDHLFGELEPSESLILDAHLQTCSVCALECRTLEQTLELAQVLPGGPVEPAPQVIQSLRTLVEQQVPWHKRVLGALWERISTPIPAWQAMLGGAALALVFQVGLSIPESTQAHRQASPMGLHPAASAQDRIVPVLEENSTPQSADALPSDQFANAW